MIQTAIGLDDLPSIMNDLVAVRIFELASKLRSLDLMEQYFGIRHSRKALYKFAPICIKDLVEGKILSFAKAHYALSYDLLFYDATTLYFETFKEDELRKNGFSKDNKSQQPQILVALMVSKEGFPVTYEIFSGNTFEGKTIVLVISDFIKRDGVDNFTVVADAAMISTANVNLLFNYIVGARLDNVTAELLQDIDKKLSREEGKNIRIKTESGNLICTYSAVRYRKDKYEMEKQIDKAKQVVEKPSNSKKLKFTQTDGQQISLNEALIEKTTKLLGIKGYYTNLDEVIANNAIVIERYPRTVQGRTGFQNIQKRLTDPSCFPF